MTGLSREEATRLLAAQGLAFEAEGNGDLVARQIPEPGQSLSAGDLIRISIIDSPQAHESAVFTMPDLTGMSMRRAYFLTQELGLKADLAGYGKVVEQTPQAGVSVEKGTRVVLRGNQNSIMLAGGAP